MALAALVCAPIFCVGEILERSVEAVAACICCECGILWARGLCRIFRQPFGSMFLFSMILGVPMGVASSTVAGINHKLQCGTPVTVDTWLYVATCLWFVNILISWLFHVRCRKPYDPTGVHRDYLSRANDMIANDLWTWLYILFFMGKIAWAVVGIYTYRSIDTISCGNTDISLMMLVCLWSMWIHIAIHVIVVIGGLVIVEGERLLCCLCAEILCCRPCRRRKTVATDGKDGAQTAPGGAAKEDSAVLPLPAEAAAAAVSPAPAAAGDVDLEKGCSTPTASASASASSTAPSSGVAKEAAAPVVAGASVVGTARKVGTVPAAAAASAVPSKTTTAMPSSSAAAAPSGDPAAPRRPSGVAAGAAAAAAGGAGAPVSASVAIPVRSA